MYKYVRWFLFPAILGGATALTYPPMGMWWVIFITVPLLLHYSKKHPLWFGFVFFLAYNLINYSWIYNAFLARGGDFVYFSLLGLGGTAITLSAFLALALWCAWITRRFIKFELAFSVYFGIFSYIRLLLMPWNAMGYMWLGFLPFAQIASIIGIYGLNVLVIALPSFFYVAIINHNIYGKIMGGLVSGILLGMLVFGYGRLSTHPSRFTTISAGLMQTHYTEQEKWNELGTNNVVSSLLQNSKGFQGLIVWPETALLSFTPAIQQQLQYTGNTWIGGIFQVINAHYYNVALYLNGDKVVYYQKRRLAPFGEYIPLTNWLQFLGVRINTITPGKRDIPMWQYKGLYLVPNICYEIAYPENIIPKNAHTDMLVHITNDAWFGNNGLEVYQHRAMAQLRAIENGIGVLMVSNYGWSGVIDPLGRIITDTHIEHTSQFKQVTLLQGLQKTTWFQIWGKYTWIIMVVCIGLLGFGLRKKL